jgi:hypothetical protein
VFFYARKRVPDRKCDTDEGLTALRGTPNIVTDLVQIFTSADQHVEVQECVMAIVEKSSKDHGEQAVVQALKCSLKCRSFHTLKFRTPHLVASCSSRAERDEP